MTNASRKWWLAIAATAAVGFGVRLWSLLDESIFLDEVSLLWLASHRSFGGMLKEVNATENSPVFGFALAWLARHAGSAPAWIRVPSLIAGTALIPAAGMLGRRAAGPQVGLAAAAFVATSPFLVFFGVEARPYALTCLLSTLAALLLLEATERQDGGAPSRWLAWAVLAAGAILSHYTAVFPIAVQVLWVVLFHPRSRGRATLASLGAAMIFCAIWLGSFLTQYSHSDEQVSFNKFVAPLSPKTIAELIGTQLGGRPIAPLADLPGPIAGSAILAVLLLALYATVRALARTPAGQRAGVTGGFIQGPFGLLAMLSILPLTGLVIAGILTDGSFLLARNSICSVPPILILLAAALDLLTRRTFLLCAAGLTVVFLAITVVSIADWARPDARSAAESIADRWRPGDVIVQGTNSNLPAFDGDLAAYLPRGLAGRVVLIRPALGTGSSQRKARGTRTGAAFAMASRSGGSVFTVSLYAWNTPVPPPPYDMSFHPTWRYRAPGVGPISVTEWTARR